MTADANVVVKATLHLSPYIGAAYNLVRLYFNLSFENTLTAHAIFRGADSEDVPESRDGCDPVCKGDARYGIGGTVLAQIYGRF